MEENNVGALAAEVAALRRDNEALAAAVARSTRRGHRTLGLALGACAFAFFTGQAGGKVVESDTFLGKSFDVKGKNDKIRASFGVDEKGTFPQICLLDNKERIRLQIGLDKEGEGLITLFDKEGKVTKQVSADSK